MALFDAHCDMLFKLWENPAINVYEDEKLHVSISKLKKMEKPIQCFAIFVPESVPFVHKLDAAQQQINIFYQKILSNFNEVKLLKTKSDIDDLKHEQIGVILTLEGCDAVGDRLENLELLYELGIRSVGLTWNYANLVADGSQETRNAGITNFGKEVIAFLNKKRLWTDLSHASERSFWEGLDLADYPIASHSNTHHLCPHVRNLKDEQIVALFRKNGMMGITFVPFFTTNHGQATIKDVLKHIDHLCSLGGENHVGFGSDFDGIDQTIEGLENYLCYEHFINELQRHYPESLVEKFIYQNFVNHVSY